MTNQFRIRLRYIYLMALGYWGVLFILTHVPSAGGVKLFPHADKIAHFVAYLGLAFLLTWAVQTRRSLQVSAITALVIAVVYAVLDELMQLFVPGRTADVLDVAADICGATAGVGIFAIAAFAFSSPVADLRREA